MHVVACVLLLLLRWMRHGRHLLFLLAPPGENKLQMYKEKFGEERVAQMLPQMTVSAASLVWRVLRHL